MDLGLRGAVTLVVGGGRGIGLATAAELLGEASKVVLTARTLKSVQDAEAVLLERFPEAEDDLVCCVADATSVEDMGALVENAEDRWGRVDGVVAVVGAGLRLPFGDAAPEIWERNWRLNLLSAVTVARAALPTLVRRGGGGLVLLGAASGVRPTPGQVVSNVHKAGVIALGRSLADQYAASGVRVNVVSPGRILTERRRARATRTAEADDTSVDAVLEQTIATIPMRRLGTAEDVAGLIAFLCSPRASYITGQNILVDGGLASSGR